MDFETGSEMEAPRRPCSGRPGSAYEAESSSSDDDIEDEEEDIFSKFDGLDIPMSRASFPWSTTTIDNEDPDGGDVQAVVEAAKTRGQQSDAGEGFGYGGVWADFDWADGYGHVCGDSPAEITCSIEKPPKMLRQAGIGHSTARRGGSAGQGRCEGREREGSPSADEAAAATFLPQSMERQLRNDEEHRVTAAAAGTPPSPVARRRRSSSRRGNQSPRSVSYSRPVHPSNQLSSPPRPARVGSIPQSTPSPPATPGLPDTAAGDQYPADSAAGSDGAPEQQQSQQAPRPPIGLDAPRTEASGAVSEGIVAAARRQLEITVDGVQDFARAARRRRDIAVGSQRSTRYVLEGEFVLQCIRKGWDPYVWMILEAPLLAMMRFLLPGACQTDGLLSPERRPICASIAGAKKIETTSNRSLAYSSSRISF